jgi:UDP-N-acetylmuramoylalanine--D-glutamate ligase
MNNNRIVILGGGESGVGVALLAKSKGFAVFLSDSSAIQEQYATTLKENQIEYEEGRHTDELILNATEIIKSPGIPDTVPILKEAVNQKIPVISEIEFAARYTKGKIIAITGSNGKTTTTLLTYHLLKSAGYNVGVAGNVGNSFAKEVIEDKYDYWVLEISSFQLDNCYQFKPDVAVMLNITPDHLDRYDNNFQTYINSKFRLVQNADRDTAFIYFKDNPAVARELKRRLINGQYFPISLTEALDNGAYLRNQELFFHIKKTNFSFSLSQAEVNLKGKHNMVNVMAAVLACLKVGVEVTNFAEYFKTFEGVEHRLEEVTTISGVKFINDSKATNVDSVYYALDSFDEKIIWIAGGVDKGNDYSKIREMVDKKVKFLICLGIDNNKLFNFFRDTIRIVFQTDDIKDAVEQAFELAKPGDIVLLSPACASFDLFQNYEDRGNQFKKAVQKLSKLSGMKRE